MTVKLWRQKSFGSFQNIGVIKSKRLRCPSIDRGKNCKLLSRETIEVGMPGLGGQDGLGLSDVVRLVVQVVAQEMYLGKYNDLM